MLKKSKSCNDIVSTTIFQDTSYSYTNNKKQQNLLVSYGDFFTIISKGK